MVDLILLTPGDVRTTSYESRFDCMRITVICYFKPLQTNLLMKRVEMRVEQQIVCLALLHYIYIRHLAHRNNCNNLTVVTLLFSLQLVVKINFCAWIGRKIY